MEGQHHEEGQIRAAAEKEGGAAFHKARRFDRQTHQPGKQDGALGRNGLAVLHALLFDFLNYATGRLDPAMPAIARKADISTRSVARARQSQTDRAC